MLSASPQPHHIHSPPSSFGFMNSQSTSNLSLKSSGSRSRKHSLTLSNPMGWLSRQTTQSSVSSFYKSSKSPREERKQTRSIELLSSARTGPLGSGATVVRTPEDALHDSGMRFPFERRPSLQRSSTSTSKRLDSPPLPCLPVEVDSDLGRDTYYDEDNDSNDASLEAQEQSWPTPPTRALPPPPPPQPSLRSSLKVKSRSSADLLQVPSLPAVVAQPPPQAPFEPLLMSGVPPSITDPSAVLVTLETCTATYKSTMKTLTSRPSHLSSYLLSLVPRARPDSVASSIYSTASDDMSTYRNHLTSQGLLPQSPVNIHLFLDRPSAPYAHILSYLRSPVGESDAVETLPRAVQLHPTNSQSRLEALLELRDEAAHLDLGDLYKLCSDEIRLRQPPLQPRLPRTHSRGQSSTSTGVQSQHTALSSMDTLLDRSGGQTPGREPSVDARSIKAPVETSDSLSISLRSPPTPESWKDGRNSGSSSGRRGRRNDLARSPPAGWI